MLRRKSVRRMQRFSDKANFEDRDELELLSKRGRYQEVPKESQTRSRRVRIV